MLLDVSMGPQQYELYLVMLVKVRVVVRDLKVGRSSQHKVRRVEGEVVNSLLRKHLMPV
jgi:hypothetical protein